MTERDELAALIWGDGDWEAAKRMHARPYVEYPEVGRVLNAVDCILAAGWRLVPEGSIVVSREDVRIVTSVMDGVPLEPSPKRYADAMDRLYAALEDADA